MRIRPILKTKKARARTARLAFILAVFLVLYGAAGYWVTWARETYDKYVQSRNQTFIVHDPFSRKLFNIDRDRVHYVWLISKFTTDTEHPDVGGRYEYNIGSAGLESDEYIDEVVDLLNSFEFTFVRGQFEHEFWTQGNAGLQVFYDLETRKNWDRVSKKLVLSYMPDCLYFGDFAYYGDEEFFKKLCAIGEKYVEYSPGDLAPVF